MYKSSVQNAKRHMFFSRLRQRLKQAIESMRERDEDQFYFTMDPWHLGNEWPDLSLGAKGELQNVEAQTGSPRSERGAGTRLQGHARSEARQTTHFGYAGRVRDGFSSSQEQEEPHGFSSSQKQRAPHNHFKPHDTFEWGLLEHASQKHRPGPPAEPEGTRLDRSFCNFHTMPNVRGPRQSAADPGSLQYQSQFSSLVRIELTQFTRTRVRDAALRVETTAVPSGSLGESPLTFISPTSTDPLSYESPDGWSERLDWRAMASVKDPQVRVRAIHSRAEAEHRFWLLIYRLNALRETDPW